MPAQCVAVCCSVLQYAATHCNTLLSLSLSLDRDASTVCCSVLQCVAVYCSMLQTLLSFSLSLDRDASTISLSLDCESSSPTDARLQQQTVTHCNTLQHQPYTPYGHAPAGITTYCDFEM